MPSNYGAHDQHAQIHEPYYCQLKPRQPRGPSSPQPSYSKRPTASKSSYVCSVENGVTSIFLITRFCRIHVVTTSYQIATVYSIKCSSCRKCIEKVHLFLVREVSGKLVGLELSGPQLAMSDSQDIVGVAFAVCCVPCFDNKRRGLIIRIVLTRCSARMGIRRILGKGEVARQEDGE